MTVPVRRWGLIGTLAWSLVIALAFVWAQLTALAICIVAHYGPMSEARFWALASLQQRNGDVVALCTLASFVVCSSLLAGIVKLRKGTTLRDHLGLRGTDRRTAIRWLIATVALIIVTDVATLFLANPVEVDFMLSTYGSASSMLLFVLALTIAAPVFEELFFRGFLVAGLERTALGPVGAVLITAILWAAMHLQYDLFGMVAIFVTGLMFGTARIRSGSTLLTMGLHAFYNLVSIIETAVLAH